jgi:pimeloyl-ACP methyl ester carboxylesterase
MKILYFHSGPGLNANPERNLLTDKFKAEGYELECWNEPSALRPDEFVTGNGYLDYLNSAEAFLLKHYKGRPLIIVAHSFSANAACWFAQKHPDKLKHIVFVTPNLSPANTDLNTFKFIMADYRSNNDSKADELEIIIENYTGKFDDNTLNGFLLAGQNPRLFNYYWHNNEVKPVFLSYFTSPEYVLDLEGYLAIRKTWFATTLTGSSIPATVVFGKHDKVISNDIEKRVLKIYFDSLTPVEFEASAHYPHAEETDKFLQILGRQIK